jgi:hypothetical protein
MTTYTYCGLSAIVESQGHWIDGVVVSGGSLVGTIVMDQGNWSVCLYGTGWMSPMCRTIDEALEATFDWMMF